ncbi:MAG: hypothetical protein AB8H86_20260 [Polyangiales bacterium]
MLLSTATKNTKTKEDVIEDRKHKTNTWTINMDGTPVGTRSAKSSRATSRREGARARDWPTMARWVRARIRTSPPRGYVRGKTRLRNDLVDQLGLTPLRAEMFIDHMESSGAIEYAGSPDRLDHGMREWLVVE